jgi:hypothetical protein
MASDLIMGPGPGSEVISPTIGEEFVEWAEQYWALKKKYEDKEQLGSESCPYDYVKSAFAEKIDEIIQSRISNKL